MRKLLTNQTEREEFLKRHIFPGLQRINLENPDSRLIAIPVQEKCAISEFLVNGRKAIVSRPDFTVVLEIIREIRVKEGIIQVLRRIR